MGRRGGDVLIGLKKLGNSRRARRVRVATFFFFCVGITLLSSNAIARRPLPREPLEQYGDPPMHIFRLGASQQRVSGFGAFTSYQVNVDLNGNNITGDAANEPSITVNPTNHDQMTIGWRQFDTVSSNFRQAGWGYTTNGGVSWTFPGVLEEGVFRSDPVLSANSEGNLFYLSLLTTFFDTMFRSLNGGQSWTNLGPATGGDKQWLTIDNTNSVGHGFQYQYWSTAGNNYPGRQFSRSIDDGFTWEDPVSIPNSPVWGTLDVDTGGNLYLAGVNFDTGLIWCERSTNAKNSAVTPTFSQSAIVNLGGDIGSGELINPAGLVGQIFLVVDKSGTSTNNNVYLLASVLPTGSTTGSDVKFVRSTDAGLTFSLPHRVNDDPINHSKWHWLAALSVAPNGRLDAIWLDTRNAANNTDSQLFYSYSHDAGVTWSPNVAASAPFNPFLGYPNQNKMGDYITIVSDDTGADVAYCATFNGEEDVYYVRVAPLASQFLNISTRARVLTDDQVLIAGFIVTGTIPKTVLIRGLGPSLSDAGVMGALADPTLELHQGSTILETNDSWKTRSDGSSQEAEIVATTIPPTNDLESAILATLDPGEYTAILAGQNSGTGVGLVEVYDLSSAADSQLANISTRGYVDIDDNVMIGGIIVGAGEGGGSRVVLRALGPSLAGGGVQDFLADPTLELHDVNGAILATNDNWKINDQTNQSQETEVEATTLAPTNDFESAIVTTLAPGNYTAVLQGKNGGVGVGLVEAFNLP
jgi:hypothetical protein